MERVSIHLLVILMAFSHLIISCYAVPSTRTGRLEERNGDLQALSNFHQIAAEEGTKEEIINARINLGLNDYPGSGANNHHIPKPPSRK